MSAARVIPFKPHWCLAPGVTIREWCDDQGVKHKDLAEKLGISAKHMSQIITGHASYSVQVAVRLGEVTGVSAEFWFRLQGDWLVGRALGRIDVTRSYDKEKT